MLETELEKSLQEKVEEHRVIFLMLYESLQMDLRSTSYDASKKSGWIVRYPQSMANTLPLMAD